MYQCVLPWPPSVNTAYGNKSNQRRFKSKCYKTWLEQAPELAHCGSAEDPVHVLYTFFFPDKRKRDLTNYLKVPEDYLVSQGVLWDDNHTVVGKVTAEFGGIDRRDPRVEILVEALRLSSRKSKIALSH